MNRGEFGREVYRRLSIPSNGKTLTFFVAWAAFENNHAANNPLSTTEDWEDCTDYNSVGVKNYLNWLDGVMATVATLNNGAYDYLLKVLRNEKSTPREMMGALNSSPWGSTVSESLYVSVERNYGEYNVDVQGSSLTPPPSTLVATSTTEEPTAVNNPLVVPATTPTDAVDAVPTVETPEPTEPETTPVVDSLEDRLANLPKPESVQESMDKQKSFLEG